MKKLIKVTGAIALVMAVLLFNNVKAQDSNIVELAMQTDDLSTLVTAVKAAGLVETLESEGPFTVFAPTNKAFEALPEGVLEMLLMPENKAKLIAVLTYHVVPSEVMAGDLEDGMMAATVEGTTATISLKEGVVMVDNATVSTADIMASNGVIHIIDTVILPPSIKNAMYSDVKM